LCDAWRAEKRSAFRRYGSRAILLRKTLSFGGRCYVFPPCQPVIDLLGCADAF
jgi:hypothetical protein